MLSPPPGYKYPSSKDVSLANDDFPAECYNIPKPCVCVLVEESRYELYVFRCGGSDSSGDTRPCYIQYVPENGNAALLEGIDDLDQLVTLMTQEIRKHDADPAVKINRILLPQIEEPSSFHVLETPSGFDFPDEDEKLEANRIFPVDDFRLHWPHSCILIPARLFANHQDQNLRRYTYIYYCGPTISDPDYSEDQCCFIAWIRATDEAYLLEGFPDQFELIRQLADDQKCSDKQSRKILWRKLEKSVG